MGRIVQIGYDSALEPLSSQGNALILMDLG